MYHSIINCVKHLKILYHIQYKYFKMFIVVKVNNPINN